MVFLSSLLQIFRAKKQRKKLSLIDKYNKDRYGHIIVMENICFKSIYASIDLFPIEKEMREKKKANQETMININWKTLFCAIQRHIRRTVYQPHEP